MNGPKSCGSKVYINIVTEYLTRVITFRILHEVGVFHLGVLYLFLSCLLVLSKLVKDLTRSVKYFRLAQVTLYLHIFFHKSIFLKFGLSKIFEQRGLVSN